MPGCQTITAYGESELQVVGRALLQVRHGDLRCRFDCKLGGSARHLTTAGMQSLSRYEDSSISEQQSLEDVKVYTVGDRESLVTKEQLVKKYPSVFTDGVGLLEGENQHSL